MKLRMKYFIIFMEDGPWNSAKRSMDLCGLVGGGLCDLALSPDLIRNLKKFVVSFANKTRKKDTIERDG